MNRTVAGLLSRIYAILFLASIAGILFGSGDKGVFWLLAGAIFVAVGIGRLIEAWETFSVERVSAFLTWFVLAGMTLAGYAACRKLLPSLVRGGAISDPSGEYTLEEPSMPLVVDGHLDLDLLEMLEGPAPGPSSLLDRVVLAMAGARDTGCAPDKADALANEARARRAGTGSGSSIFRDLAALARTGQGGDCARAVASSVSGLARPAMSGALRLSRVPSGWLVEVETDSNDGSFTKGRVEGSIDRMPRGVENLTRVPVGTAKGSLIPGILPPSSTLSLSVDEDGRVVRLEITSRDRTLLAARLKAVR